MYSIYHTATIFERGTAKPRQIKLVGNGPSTLYAKQ